tara:strand:- start:300 stop:551 length:252 start_codon:yes stop_codon:yes gene_type:complete
MDFKEQRAVANAYFREVQITELETSPSYGVYEVVFQDKTYKFCLARSKNNYSGNLPVFIFSYHSVKLATSVCWKKIIKPTLEN